MVIKEKIQEKINKLKENRYEIAQKAKDAALVSACVASVVGLVATIGLVANAPKAVLKQEKALGENMLNEANSYVEIVNGEEEKPFENIIFSGADFVEKDGGYDVSICGIGSKEGEGNKKHFVNLEYSDVNDADVKKFIKKDKEIDFYKALNHIIENYELESYSDYAVESINELNSAVRGNTEQKYEDYDFGKNFVYTVKNIEFNDKDKTVSFETKQNARYSKEDKKVMKSGSMTYFKDVTKNKDTSQSYTIQLKVSDAEFEEMKADPSKAIEKFIELSAEKENEKVSVNVNYVKENPNSFELNYGEEMQP